MLDKSFAYKCKVLVIEDQELALGYLKYPLEQLGFHDISYADRIKDVMQLVNTRVYDLIICAYEFRQEKDGYFLYDELKRRNMLSLRTTFVFVSADTSKELINSVLELQPDDFLVKPFTPKDLSKRLNRAMMRKKVLRKVYHLMQQGNYPVALESINALLADASQADYFPTALKVKGEILLALKDGVQAKKFYQAIIDVQAFSWAQMGLIKALLQLDEDLEAEKYLLRLAIKPDAQIQAYDMLTDLQIKQQDYEGALDSTVVASEVSPRNLHRHKKVVDLSRLTNDYKTQFEASKRLVKYAKGSMHDKPGLYLDAARAGIDFAMTTEQEETESLSREASQYLEHFAENSDKKSVQEQLDICQARLFQLQDDEDSAKAILARVDSNNWAGHNNEDLLDLSKAFHAVGMHEQCQQAIEIISQRVAQKSNPDTLYQSYLQKEKQQKQAIRHTPKELNNQAVDFYRMGDNQQALVAFGKAFSVMPKNTSIALNLLQVLSIRGQSQTLDQDEKALVKKCLYTIENGQLSMEQKDRYLKIKTYLSEIA